MAKFILWLITMICGNRETSLKISINVDSGLIVIQNVAETYSTSIAVAYIHSNLLRWNKSWKVIGNKQNLEIQRSSMEWWRRSPQTKATSKGWTTKWQCRSKVQGDILVREKNMLQRLFMEEFIVSLLWSLLNIVCSIIELFSSCIVYRIL